MRYVTVTSAPATEPVSLSEARLQCRVDLTDEDALLTAYTAAAREYVEQLTGRALITQTRLLLCDVTSEPVELSGAPVASVLSVSTVDVPQDATAATATIGAGENGTVTVTAVPAGEGGNAYAVEVEVASGNDQPLSAVLLGDTLTVTLGTDGAGAPDDAKNTATLVAAAITAIATFTASASGTGATALTAAEGPTDLTGGFGTLTALGLGEEYELDRRGVVPTVRITEMPGDAETIRIEYVCGYGAAADVPQALKQSILLLVANWYAQREATAGSPQHEVPFAVQALCSPYRVQWFGG